MSDSSAIYTAIFGQRAPADIVREFKIETPDEAEAWISGAVSAAQAQGLTASDEDIDEVVKLTLADLVDELNEPRDGDLERAIAHLSAEHTPSGDWRWLDDATARYHVADDDDLAQLGVALRLGREDAYSHWCAETTTDEATLEDIDARVAGWLVTRCEQPHWDDETEEEVTRRGADIDWCRPVDCDIRVALGTAAGDITVEVRGARCGVRQSDEVTARMTGPEPFAGLWTDETTCTGHAWIRAHDVLEYLDPRKVFESLGMEEVA